MKHIIFLCVLIASCANPKPEPVPVERIEVTDGTPMPDSITISCKGITRTISYAYYRNIDLKMSEAEKQCAILVQLTQDEWKEKKNKKKQ